jgi:hypothetical protein
MTRRDDLSERQDLGRFSLLLASCLVEGATEYVPVDTCNKVNCDKIFEDALCLG